MEQEPKELSEIRSQLEEFERLHEYPQRLDRLSQVITHVTDLDKLSQAISLIDDLIASDCPHMYKDRAKRLLLAYADKTLARVRSMLASPDTFDTDTLKHWYDIMVTFDNTGFFDHLEFSLCKEQLFEKWVASLFDNMSLSERELLVKHIERVSTDRENQS